MARRRHKPEPREVDPGDDGTGYAAAVCRFDDLDITRRYNTQLANRVAERDPDVDLFGPEFWYWTHNRRPLGEDDVQD